MDDGWVTHWCPKCNRWTTTHTGAEHRARGTVGAPQQANVASEMTGIEEEVPVEAMSNVTLADSLTQKEIKEMGKGKITALLAKINAVNFD